VDALLPTAGVVGGGLELYSFCTGEP